MSMVRGYSEEQLDWLRAMSGQYNSYRDIRNDFNIKFGTDKTVGAIQQILSKKLKVYIITDKSTTHYTKEQEDWLRMHYRDFTRYSELTAEFNRTFRRTKPISAIQEKCTKGLGLIGMDNPGQYKKLNIKEQCPIGTVRKCVNGCSYIKVKDSQHSYMSGYREPYWLPIQKKIWMDHYGEVPEGNMVIFLDGDHDNLNIENLYCIDRRISGYLATNGWYTHDGLLTLTAIKLCELIFGLKDSRKKGE